MTEGIEKSIIDKIWDIFASIKTAVIIFSIISLTSIVGTILEQGAEPETNIKILSKLFGESIAPTAFNILYKLGFTDMYRSEWFNFFLLLFAANIIICSLDRLPRILKIVKEPIRPLSNESLEKFSLKKTLTLKGKSSNIKEHVATSLRKIGFKTSESSEGSSLQLYSEKGNFSRLGVYITHLSILIILAGAIIGSFFGFNGYLPLQEGETSSFAYRDRNLKEPLGFQIRCDNFEVDFYGGSNMPKDYTSWLSIIKNGKVVKRKSIEVNDPLKYEGITFYQSNYGTVPDKNSGIFIFRIYSSDGKSVEINPRVGDKFTIPGTSIEGHIKFFSPALAIDPDGRSFTFDELLVNPAVFIEFWESGKQKYSGWILKRNPRTWILPDGNKLEFLGYWGVEYTGLQVRKDPGVLFVYLGCIIMSIGLYITFFMSHKKIWVNMVEEKNTTRILIGAAANKNRSAFERKIEKLVSILSASQKGEK